MTIIDFKKVKIYAYSGTGYNINMYKITVHKYVEL